MNNNTISETDENSTVNKIAQFIWRLVISMIILGITAFFTPGFSIKSVWALALASIILSVVDYIIASFTNINKNALGKGIIGFILAAISLYVMQFLVAGYAISWLGAIIGALVYGVVDYLIPGND